MAERLTMKKLEARMDAKDEADDELHTDLTKRLESAEASLRKAHARLDEASKAFAALKEQRNDSSSRNRAPRSSRSGGSRQTRFPCTVDKCEGHANQFTVERHQKYVAAS